MTSNAGWHPDPYGRHELRYYDGTQWTANVSDNGTQSSDATGLPPAVPTATAVPGMGPSFAQSSEPAFRLMMFGADDRLFSHLDLQNMAKAGVLRPETMVQHRSATYAVPASQVPGVFSDKTWISTLLISFFLGGLGIDRFYLGYTGIGVAKLLTLGGCGIWALVDFIMIAMRSVPDAQGRPLA